MRRTLRPILPGDALTGKDVAIYTADSWEDFVSSVEASTAHARYTGPKNPASRDSGCYYGGKEWSPHGWRDSLNLARSGWYEMEAKIRSMSESIARINAGSMCERVAFQMSCQGEEYDVGALLEGVPECMFLPTPEITQGRTIYRIGVYPGASGGEHPEAFIKQGAMTCALVASLEARGQTCEVFMSSRCGGGYGETTAIQIDVPLMSAGDPIDVPFLAFAVAHPSVYRRFTFAMMEADERCVEMGTGFGYGYVQNRNGIPSGAPFDVCVPMAEHVSGWSDQKMAEWLTGELERIEKGKL